MIMTSRHDVVIVGAGPAGSTAAHRLACAGINVALLDQATFPREKSCGDGVGLRGLDVLERSGLGKWAQGFLVPAIYRMSSPDEQVLDVRLPLEEACFGRDIPRFILDARLVEMAAAAGAQLHESTRVTDVTLDQGSRVRVTAGNEVFEADLLILADGSHAPLTRRLGLARHDPDLYAIRQYFSGDRDTTHRIEIHFQHWILPGYSWIFPENEGRVNVGTGTFSYRLRREGVDLKQFLDRFLSEQHLSGGRLLDAIPDGSIRGHPLRTELGRSRTHDERIMVVGDAAGLVNPMSGEGISSGMESGELAARIALKSLAAGDFSNKFLSAYTRELQAKFMPDWRAARFLRRILTRPRMLNYLFRRMQTDEERALLFGYLIINYVPQRRALRPRTLLRLLA
jgi:geranylgeranyl reductase family protein